jgi:hypothetical protein
MVEKIGTSIQEGKEGKTVKITGKDALLKFLKEL